MLRSAILVPLLVTSLLAANQADARPRDRLLVVGLQGASAPLIERMLAAGAMPYLARMRETGAMARLAPLPFGGSAAAGQATLWTGALGAGSGVTGTFVPAPERAVNEAYDGWSGSTLKAEPLFVTAARQGLEVQAFDVPHATPFDAFEPQGAWGRGVGDRLAIATGESAGAEGIWTAAGEAEARGWWNLPESRVPPREVPLELAGDRLYALLFDDPADPKAGFDTVYVTQERSGRLPLARLKPRAPMAAESWSQPVPVATPAGVRTIALRLFELAPDGSRMRLYHTAPARYQTNRPARTSAFVQAAGAYVPGGGAQVYRAGGFGRTLAEGGDGTAEARYLDTVRQALYRRQAAMRHLLGAYPWDLMLTTVPFPQEAAAMWQGYLDPKSPAYMRRLAVKLEPMLQQSFAELDAYLGALHGALPQGASMAVASFNALAPVKWDFYPNVALHRAGLLALTPDGKLDLAHTRAYFPPDQGGYLLVNTRDRAGGIVPAAEREQVLSTVRQALGRVRVKTPRGVVALVHMIPPTSPIARSWGLGGKRGGDLYLTLERGYGLDAALAGDELFLARAANASAARVLDPQREEGQGFLVVTGPAARRGARAIAAGGVDVAPTLSAMLGIPAPGKSTGHVIPALVR